MVLADAYIFTWCCYIALRLYNIFLYLFIYCFIGIVCRIKMTFYLFSLLKEKMEARFFCLSILVHVDARDDARGVQGVVQQHGLEDQAQDQHRHHAGVQAVVHKDLQHVVHVRQQVH